MGELKKQDEVEIDIKDIMTLILQNAGVIIMAAFCVGIFLFTKTKSQASTVYTSTSKMYILSKNSSSASGTESKFYASVLADYQALVTSKEVLEEVNRKLEADHVVPVTASQISVIIGEDSKVVNLSVTDANPIASMKKVNTIRNVMTQYIKNTMDINLFDVVEEALVGVPSRVDKAKRNAVLGGFVVACMIMGAIVMRYLIDDSLKVPEEIESKLGLSVLAVIPTTNKQNVPKKKKRLWAKNKKQVDKE